MNEFGTICGNNLQYDQENSICFGSVAYAHSDITLPEGGEDMSCVGIFKCYEGMVAFGDRRNTIVENQRGFASENTVKKVFKGKDCLLVTHGHNTYKNPEGNPREKLETLLEDLTRQYPFRKLFVPLFQALQPSLYPSSGKTYCFIVGVKEYPSSSIYQIKISSDEIIYRKCEDTVSCIHGGCLTYALTNIQYHENEKSLEDIVELAKTYYEIAEKYGNRFLQYNPVGDGLDMKILDFSANIQ